MDGSNEPRLARWSVAWHGYVRERKNGQIVREEGADMLLEVYEDGNWVVCGGAGCVVLADDDPDRFERLAVCLLGREPKEAA